MSNRPKSSLSLLLLLLVGLLAAAGYLLLRDRRVTHQQQTISSPAATPYVIQLPRRVAPNSPIIKQVYEGGSTALYTIRGSLTTPLEQQPRLLVGKFSLDGDTSEREFLVQLGSTENKLLLGTFKGSFAGDSAWRGCFP